ncbi:hypothetical protein ACIA74_09585 [Streptomyces sp. NPDC051658]|uniref:hypothetical protein n=1 Tax=Streptomyces sp. NPDC051658 TaxID=3365667 RepID=UPI00379C70AD
MPMVVRQMARDAAAELGGREALTSEGEILTYGGPGSRTPAFRPDVLLAFPTPDDAKRTRFLAVDAKYKSYAEKNVSAPDRHQLLTYISGYTTPDSPPALVVHPSSESPTERVLRVDGPRGHLGTIVVLGLHTGITPRAAAEPLRKAIEAHACVNGPVGPPRPGTTIGPQPTGERLNNER